MGGAFQTSRDIFLNPIWQDVPKFRIFFYIVGNAVFSDDGVRVGGVHLKRGQYLRSYRNLQEDLTYLENRSIKKYSLSVIKRKIDQLILEKRLEIEECELGTLFTVVNYAIYQGFEHYKSDNENTERTAMEQGWNNNKKDKKDKKDNNKKPSCHKFEICDMEMAKLLFQRILANNENAKHPNFEAWANEVRLMREKDNRTINQIEYLINWSQNDSFWKTNILSTSKLRSKFDQLVIKCKEEKEKSKRTGTVRKSVKKEDYDLSE
jgi:hypothetical protein